MSARHTQGPWSAAKFADTKSHTIYAAGAGKSIGTAKGPTPEEQGANARLMAAAPDLLRVLQDAASHLEFVGWPPVVDCGESMAEAICKRARDAIAKATGQE